MRNNQKVIVMISGAEIVNAVRSFSDRPIEPEKMQKILKAGRLIFNHRRFTS